MFPLVHPESVLLVRVLVKEFVGHGRMSVDGRDRVWNNCIETCGAAILKVQPVCTWKCHSADHFFVRWGWRVKYSRLYSTLAQISSTTVTIATANVVRPV